MIEINACDLKIIIPILIYLILLIMTIMLPGYSFIWEILFWIGIVYLFIKSQVKSKNGLSVADRLKDIHITVKITFTLAILVGIWEIHTGNDLMFSTAILVLAILMELLLDRKKEECKS